MAITKGSYAAGAEQLPAATRARTTAYDAASEVVADHTGGIGYDREQYAAYDEGILNPASASAPIIGGSIVRVK